jgi:hypothetical protein
LPYLASAQILSGPQNRVSILHFVSLIENQNFQIRSIRAN